MSRRVAAGRKTMGTVEGGENLPGRIAKYIPAEIVALYLGAKGIVPSDEADKMTIICIIFWACLALTPIYLALATREPGKGPLWLQVVLATIAFPIWTLAIGGGCCAFPEKRQFIASLILMFVTFIFGFIRPHAETQ